MEYTYHDGEIIYPDKELTLLDRVVIDFIPHLKIKYVIVSGYVAILFGRSRNTEDVDIFIEEVGYTSFSKIYHDITESGKYYCINAEDSKDAYELLREKIALRFAEKNTETPNFEIKFPQNELNSYSLEHAITVRLNGKYLIRIGPLELQLAYKLYLGSEKDYLDATHLYEVFKPIIDKEELRGYLIRLHIKTSTVKKILGDNI